MADYGNMARFYDRAMADPSNKISRLCNAIAEYLPGASSLLELGCGTGAILAGLPKTMAVTGLDRSPEMLAVAQDKLPEAKLIQGELPSFDFAERFDVVACVSDTLNHLPRFAQWEEVFRRSYDHLTNEGLFIFDVNTIGQLRRLSQGPPWVNDFDGNTIIMNISMATDELSHWDIRVFERINDSNFVLHRERIAELGVELARIKAALGESFSLLEEVDADGASPTDESRHVYFVARRLRTTSR